MAQEQWKDILEQSTYSDTTLADIAKIDVCSFRKYINNERTPRKKNMKIMEEIMDFAKKEPKLTFHPSYGYASEHQINKLKTLGVCIERDLILKQIEKQTKNRGKEK